MSIVLLGFFQLGLSYLLFSRGIRLTSPLNASLLAMAEPLMSPVWVFLFLGEKPGWIALVGALAVIGSIVFLNAGKMKRRET